jgi:hypothetical protein
LLLKADLLKSETVVEEGDASDETSKKVKIKKEAVSKKPVSTGAPIKASKSSNSRKVAPVKTGSSRGK